LRQIFRIGRRTRQPVRIAVQCRVVVINELLHTPLAAGQPHGDILTRDMNPEQGLYSRFFAARMRQPGSEIKD
jgi:hypothetical protein